MCLDPAEDLIPGRPYSETDLPTLPPGLIEDLIDEVFQIGAGKWDMVICGGVVQGPGI